MGCCGVVTTGGSPSSAQGTFRAQLMYPVTGTLAVGTNVALALRPAQTLIIEEVFIEVKTAPTGAAIIVDVNKNGTSIFNVTPANRPQIAAGAFTGTSGAPDTTNLVKNDQITVDVDQVGSTISGDNLSVHLRCIIVPS